MSAIRSKIREAVDLERKVVAVPEWGVSVMLHGITATERGELDRRTRIAGKDEDVNFLEVYVWPLLQMTLSDPETGEALYANTEEDRKELLGKNDHVIMRLYLEAQAICGIALDSKENAKRDF